MQNRKKVNRADGVSRVLLLLFCILSCLLGGCGQRQEASSVVRFFRTTADGEAVYLASTAETAIDAQTAGNGEAAGKDTAAAAAESAVDEVLDAGIVDTTDADREMPADKAGTVSGNTIDAPSGEVGDVFVKVNQVRKDVGLPELLWSDELAEAADIRAKEIQQTFSHTRPDGSEWWSVNREIIYGENLAKGYQSADSVMAAWMESAGHKENILYASFRSIGIAVYEYDGKWYWAQEFGY